MTLQPHHRLQSELHPSRAVLDCAGGEGLIPAIAKMASVRPLKDTP